MTEHQLRLTHRRWAWTLAVALVALACTLW